MNKKQILVLLIGAIGIIAAIFLTPRYKVTQIDANNFITTEQTSSLYKRSKGVEKFHWDRIGMICGGIALTCAGLCFFLRDKRNG